jgi:lysophospholipase L1-like esterase
MDKNTEIFINFCILISILLNLLVLIVVCVLTIKNGGFSYWRQKLANLQSFNKQKSKVLDINNPPYYIHKTSQFEILPVRNNSIIFLGDSITDEGEWTELLQNPNIQNRGISGDTTERILRRLNGIIKNNPQQIFIMVGINDLHMLHKSVEVTLEGYKEIITKFQEQLPNTKIFIQSVLPVNNNIYLYWTDNQKIIELNNQLKKLAEQHNYKYIDIHSQLLDQQGQLDEELTSDGLHLNGKAYLIWKQVITNQSST